MGRSQYKNSEEVDPRVKDAVEHHEALTGERPPTNPNEAQSKEAGQTTDHPYDSFIEGADVAIVTSLDSPSYAAEEEVITDGGFEYQRIFESADKEVVEEANDYDVDTDCYRNGVAVRGTKSEVEEFVEEFDEALNGEVATDGGGTMQDVSHTIPSNYVAEEVELEDGPQNTFE